MNDRPQRASKSLAAQKLFHEKEIPVCPPPLRERLGLPAHDDSTSDAQQPTSSGRGLLLLSSAARARQPCATGFATGRGYLRRGKQNQISSAVGEFRQTTSGAGDTYIGRRKPLPQKSALLKKLENLRNVNIEDSGSSGSDDDYSEDEDNLSVSSGSTSSDCDEDYESSDDVDDISGNDGTIWKKLGEPSAASCGRTPSHNVFRAKAGLTAYSRRVSTPLEAWKILIDDGFLRHIRRCTEDFARTTVPLWSVSDDDMEKFIGLLYLRGTMNQSKLPLDSLWSKSVGIAAFNATMPRNRFREIKKYLRFDIKSQRANRLQTDKFCMASWIVNRFTENSQKSYVPAEHLCADEQLFPTKARCRFIQYMPSKPDKYGIKFWILVEVDSKFCLCIIPYLGKDGHRVDNLGTHVIMKLMEPYFGLGYNVTTDNFFTSKLLAEKLLAQRTTLVGTVRSHRRELPPAPTLNLYESAFFEDGRINLVIYRAKANKSVYVMSTLHQGTAHEHEGKKKPESILSYNKTKCGVDLLDSMCRQMSTKSGCRRWPLAVFYNILDLAGINAWIIFRKATGSRISRRRFMFELCEELTKMKNGEGNIDNERQQTTAEKLPKRVTCQVRINCKRNLTSTLCAKCTRPVCGQCLANVCCNCENVLG
jgi:hypothetical protein